MARMLDQIFNVRNMIKLNKDCVHVFLLNFVHLIY
jgi:hypothetical protein